MCFLMVMKRLLSKLLGFIGPLQLSAWADRVKETLKKQINEYDFGNIFDTGLLDESVFKAGSNAINVALTGDVAGSNTDTEKAIKKIKETTLYPTQPKPTMNKETVKSLLEDTLSEMDDFL